MKSPLLFLLSLVLVACQNNQNNQSSEMESSQEIHQGYSETVDEYEVDGWVISNVDVKAKLWNPRGKTKEQIEARAKFLTEAYDIKRTEAQTS